jgi:uncharacterized protein (TIGR01244 family)
MVNRLALGLPFLLAPLLSWPVVAHAGEIPGSVDSALIPAYRVIEPGLAAAGQPTSEALGKLKAMGFRTVVNLRTEQEGAAAERKVVEAQGLRYVSVPVTPDTLSLADATAVEAALAGAGGRPALLHCASSNRVGALWALVQACRGKSIGEAEAAGMAAGMRPTMLPAVQRALSGAALASCRRSRGTAATSTSDKS